VYKRQDAATLAADTAQKTFEAGTLSENLPRVNIEAARLSAGVVAYEVFREAGLAASNGEARRLIKGGGARINDVAVSDESQMVSQSDVTSDGVIKVSAGKKRHVLVVPT